MSYSLSQLDAIGDVDPVAEADVYLAYGRDLQAEEILKEAMRATPERMAIRTKLLEVYAKRRDTKGFELLATQLYTLTRGADGEDWAKAQELGRRSIPTTRCTTPGGQPDLIVREGGRLVEPLDATTMPQSVMPKAPPAGRSPPPARSTWNPTWTSTSISTWVLAATASRSRCTGSHPAVHHRRGNCPTTRRCRSTCRNWPRRTAQAKPSRPAAGLRPGRTVARR